jgi:hypothetical protein
MISIRMTLAAVINFGALLANPAWAEENVSSKNKEGPGVWSVNTGRVHQSALRSSI